MSDRNVVKYWPKEANSTTDSPGLMPDIISSSAGLRFASRARCSALRAGADIAALTYSGDLAGRTYAGAGADASSANAGSAVRPRIPAVHSATAARIDRRMIPL